jgi:hypothetical protein
MHIHLRQFKIQPRILPAVRSVCEVSPNYTKQDRYVDTFIISQKQNEMQKFMYATVRRGYLLCHMIMAKRGNVTVIGLIMNSTACLKCEESEHLDMFRPVGVKVLNSFICRAK